VQVLAGGDIFPALERGAIDATEWVGPHDDEKLGFYKVAKLYYFPGWWEPGPALTFYVNRKAWDKLPRSYQEIFEAATFEASDSMQTRYDQKNPVALKRLLSAGVILKPFSDEIMAAARGASLELLEQQARQNAQYRKIYQHWKAARADLYRWFGTAELAFAQFAFKGKGS
jgi:TRAP-type mannitol/chloroaromatic compound transport system substrate-binding protein